jgi:radical SAM enzyme (TIGR01210 family)
MEKTTNGIQYSFDTDVKFSPPYQAALKRLNLYSPGRGCVPWLANRGNNCTFCHIPHATRLAVKGEGHDDNYDGWDVPTTDLEEMLTKALASDDQWDNLTIFNGGSFLTDREIPAAFREFTYQKVAAHKTIKQLMVETRAEFVTEPVIDHALENLSDKDLMVAIGFESANDFVRNTILKKFVHKGRFERAVALLQSKGAQVFAYAFLKGPGMSERESLDDALATCAYLHDLGVDQIALSCAFVPEGGYLEELYNKGEFRPPWLWTVLEIVDAAKQNGWPLTVGGFEDFPPPISVAKNCDGCTPDIHAQLDIVRQTGALPAQRAVCSCKGKWERLIIA